jgi:hypothetical protein
MDDVWIVWMDGCYLILVPPKQDQCKDLIASNVSKR